MDVIKIIFLGTYRMAHGDDIFTERKVSLFKGVPSWGIAVGHPVIL